MSSTPPTDTRTLIATLRELATAIQSEEGLAEAALIEAADRMEAMMHELALARDGLKNANDCIAEMSSRRTAGQ